jgi:hypothetical protein
MAANSERLSLGTAVSSLLALLRKPSVALVLTNTVTAGVLLYALSEGRPLRALRRLLWRAALAAVPRSLVDRELGSIKRKLERDLIGSSLDGESLVLALPDAGWTRAAVGETLARYGAADAALWRSGRISGCVYHGGDDLADVQTDAFRLYAISNPLHPDVFPRLRKVRAAPRAQRGLAAGARPSPLPRSPPHGARLPPPALPADGGRSRRHDAGAVPRHARVLRHNDERRHREHPHGRQGARAHARAAPPASLCARARFDARSLRPPSSSSFRFTHAGVPRPRAQHARRARARARRARDGARRV